MFACLLACSLARHFFFFWLVGWSVSQSAGWLVLWLVVWLVVPNKFQTISLLDKERNAQRSETFLGRTSENVQYISRPLFFFYQIYFVHSSTVCPGLFLLHSRMSGMSTTNNKVDPHPNPPPRSPTKTLQCHVPTQLTTIHAYIHTCI